MRNKPPYRNPTPPPPPAKPLDDLDIRPVRVTMDQNGTWHAIQTPDANLELVFSRKTLKLIRVKLIK